jgi:hypothetical protein
MIIPTDIRDRARKGETGPTGGRSDGRTWGKELIAEKGATAKRPGLAVVDIPHITGDAGQRHLPLSGLLQNG